MLQNAKLICTSLFLFYTLINETSENQKLRKNKQQQQQQQQQTIYLKSHQKGLNTQE